MAPCATAGSIVAVSSRAVIRCASPSRFNPAQASSVASAIPASSFSGASARCRGSRRYAGRDAAASPAWRRSDEVPSTAPDGISSIVRYLRLTNASRTSSRGSVAAIVSPGKRHVLHGMHGKVDRAGEQRLLDLLREQSLAADLDRGRSRMRSPLVVIVRISNASSPSPCAAARRARTSCACASASGEPRVPMRKGLACTPLAPGVRPNGGSGRINAPWRCERQTCTLERDGSQAGNSRGGARPRHGDELRRDGGRGCDPR